MRLSTDEWITRSWRRVVFLAISSSLVIVVGLLWSHELDVRAAHRIETGIPVTATVTRTEIALRFRTGNLKQAVVEYTVGGRKWSAHLMSGMGETGLHPGDVITLYVDPDDPGRAATKAGLLSEGKLTLLSPALYLYGGLGLTVATIASIGRFFMRRRRTAHRADSGVRRRSTSPPRRRLLLPPSDFLRVFPATPPILGRGAPSDRRRRTRRRTTTTRRGRRPERFARHGFRPAQPSPG
jgi:hypothetical protein